MFITYCNHVLYGRIHLPPILNLMVQGELSYDFVSSLILTLWVETIKLSSQDENLFKITISLSLLESDEIFTNFLVASSHC